MEPLVTPWLRCLAGIDGSLASDVELIQSSLLFKRLIFLLVPCEESKWSQYFEVLQPPQTVVVSKPNDVMSIRTRKSLLQASSCGEP